MFQAITLEGWVDTMYTVIDGSGVMAWVYFVVAVLFGVTYVDRLTGQSERLVLQGVEVTRYSKRLGSLLVGMERSARQYGASRQGVADGVVPYLAAKPGA